MFNVKSPGGKYTDTLVLLGDKIYGKNMPNAAGGKFCKYKVVKFQINEKKFKLHFMDQEIERDVTNWIEFTSNKEDEIMKRSDWSWLMKAKNSEFRRQNVMPSQQQ